MRLSLKYANWANRPLTFNKKTAVSKFVSTNIGKQVQIKWGLVGIYMTNSGVTTFYIHMKNISVSVDAEVDEGTPIGQQSGVGARGRSNLYFEVHDWEKSHASSYTKNVNDRLPYGI